VFTTDGPFAGTKEQLSGFVEINMIRITPVPTHNDGSFHDSPPTALKDGANYTYVPRSIRELPETRALDATITGCAAVQMRDDQPRMTRT
jgi:hypothetical protein